MQGKKVSLFKAFTWRVIATAATTLVVFLLSGRVDLALEVGALEATLKIGLYYFHERTWAALRFGRSRTAA
jgi:uncharacterized membrane protein